MKQIIMAALFTFIVMACQKPKEETTTPVVTDSVERSPVTLNLKWETDTVLTTSESVLYDKERDILYVSNIVGKDPSAKDNNGFISKLGLDGKITELKWIKGLHAPKGMGLSGNRLFVSDIDRVVEIDVTKGKISKTYPVKGAKFLNDITVDKDGKVFVSDMEAGTVMMIENGKVSQWLENMDGPNGLLADEGKFYVLSWNSKSFNSVDASTKQLSVLADSLNNLDGVESAGNGAFLLSSWDGQIHYVDSNGKTFTILDTRADSVNAADIEYIQEKSLLLVPTFFRNTVRAYELTK